MRRVNVRATAALAVAALVFSACSDDDDGADDTTAGTEAPATDAPEPVETEAPVDTEAPTTEAPPDTETTDVDPSAQTLEWSECEGGECDDADRLRRSRRGQVVEFLAQGETAEMEVGADAGGGVFVSVTGATEFQGKGTPVFDPATAGIDTGDITITGTGSQPDDSAPVEDFVVDASITSC